MKTTHTFKSEDLAIEAAIEINAIGRSRNKGTVVAFRDRFTVTLRPEFTSDYLAKKFSDIVSALQ